MRPTADQDTPPPSSLRPIGVLHRTLQHLIVTILGTHGLTVESFNFCFDRIRAVRKDVVYQGLAGPSTQKLLLRCLKFSALAEVVLQGADGFEAHHNLLAQKELLQTLERQCRDDTGGREEGVEEGEGGGERERLRLRRTVAVADALFYLGDPKSFATLCTVTVGLPDGATVREAGRSGVGNDSAAGAVTATATNDTLSSTLSTASAEGSAATADATEAAAVEGPPSTEGKGATDEVQWAWEVLRAHADNNYARFFALYREAPSWVHQALLHRHLPRVRAEGLETVAAAYATSAAQFPLGSLAKLLGLEGGGEAAALCRHHGLALGEGAPTVLLRKGAFKRVERPWDGGGFPEGSLISAAVQAGDGAAVTALFE